MGLGESGGVGSWRAAAGDLLLGAQCPGCDAPAWGLCRDCRQSAVGPGPYPTRPEPCPAGFPTTVTAGPYDAVLQRLISAHKERQMLGLTPFLADRLAAAVGRLLADRRDRAEGSAVVVVPVPSSPAAVRRRGFDATWAMARRAARPPWPDHRMSAAKMLTLARRLEDQAGLGAAARQQNLSGGFCVRRAGPAREVLVVVVDDVVTTGASLTEAARALRVAGMEVLGAATVAATRRSSSAT